MKKIDPSEIRAHLEQLHAARNRHADAANKYRQEVARLRELPPEREAVRRELTRAVELMTEQWAARLQDHMTGLKRGPAGRFSSRLAEVNTWRNDLLTNNGFLALLGPALLAGAQAFIDKMPWPDDAISDDALASQLAELDKLIQVEQAELDRINAELAAINNVIRQPVVC